MGANLPMKPQVHGASQASAVPDEVAGAMPDVGKSTHKSPAMTVIDANNNTTTDTATEGVPAKVTMKVSWTVFPPPTTGRRPFDPRAAARRAVTKHADALRRLSA